MNLKATNVGKNARTDDADIGVFGTAEPYKEGVVPVNLRICFKTIHSSTTPKGNNI